MTLNDLIRTDIDNLSFTYSLLMDAKKAKTGTEVYYTLIKKYSDNLINVFKNNFNLLDWKFETSTRLYAVLDQDLINLINKFYILEESRMALTVNIVIKLDSISNLHIYGNNRTAYMFIAINSFGFEDSDKNYLNNLIKLHNLKIV